MSDSRDAHFGREPGETDPFRRGQEDSAALREAMDGLREDVRAVVREEVARAGMSGADLERMVRDAVARETRREGGRSASLPIPVLVGAGLVVGLIGGAFGYGALRGGGAEEGPADLSGAAAPAAETAGTEAAGPPPAPPPPTPAQRAALYDSLLTSGSERLGPMVGRLESAGPAAPVVDAIGVWRAGGPLTPGQRRRLHDALVQLALNEESGAGLALDGLVSRGPCRGNSCGALLELWRARGAELGMPELPDDPASDSATLAVAERVLVLQRAESSGGGAG